MMKRLWVIGLVTLTALMSTAAPARAATSDMGATNRAGAWLATQVVAGHLPGFTGEADYGNTALGLLGLAATDDPSLRPTIDAMTGYLVTAGPTEGTASSRAAALAMVAAAFDLSPDAFGVDPVRQITADTAATGAIGAYPGAYGQGFALVGLARAGGAPTAAQVAWLIGEQDASGAFGYADWATGAFVADPDSTAMAVLGLSAAGGSAAEAAADLGAAWLLAQQQSNGSWSAYSPVNTTALAGMALAERGRDTARALTWLTTQQGATGALLFDGTPDIYATSQALPFLGGESYLTVTWEPATTPAPTTPAPTTPAPTTPAPVPTSTVTVTATAAPGATTTVTATTQTTSRVTVRAISASGSSSPSTVGTTAAATPEPTPTASDAVAAPSVLATASVPATPAATASPRTGTATASASGADLPLYIGGGAMLASAAAGAVWLLRKR